MSKRGSAFGGAVLGLLLFAACAKEPEPEKQGFLALDRESQNLAIYDTFWKHLEARHFDAKSFATAEWVARRAEWRKKAASEPAFLYINVLNQLALQLPHSHVGFEPPAIERQSTAGVRTIDPTQQMFELAHGGPGFVAPSTRRDLGRPVIVSEVVRGSPAERAGVEPGWILMKNHFDMTPARVRYTAELLRLSPEQVRATERTGQVPLGDIEADEFEGVLESMKARLEFELEPLPSAEEFELRKLPGNVTYLRFDRFESMELVTKVIDGIGSGANGGLILDLRRNGGGRFIHLSRIAGALLGGNVLLGTQRNSDWEGPVKSLRLTPHFEGPLAVLVGPATASAAEITAAAVQDHKRGKLFGRFTNGSVVVARKFRPARWWQRHDPGQRFRARRRAAHRGCGSGTGCLDPPHSRRRARGP